MNRVYRLGRLNIVILISIVFLVSSCADYHNSIEPYQEAPVGEWIKLSGGKDISELISVLRGLKPAPNISPEAASEWVSQLVETLPESDHWVLYLGLAPLATIEEKGFAPFLLFTEKDSVALTQIYYLTEAGASGMNTVEKPPKKVVPPKKEYRGICATLSTAYSLVYILGKRTEFGDLGTQKVQHGKKYWKKGFLETIKKDQHHSGTGTPKSMIKMAYERYGCNCEDEVFVAADAGGVQVWLEELKSKLEGEDPCDCHLIIEGDGWAHDLHIDGIDEDQIGTSNTGIQGSGSGDDVPVISGHQVWSISDGPNGPHIKCESSTGGGSAKFWNDKKPTKASYLCCKCPD